MSAILGGQVSVGHQRPRGVRAADRGRHGARARRSRAPSACPALDAPTLREQGVDVEFENWRSVVAPPGISAGGRQRLEAAVAAMVQSAAWREALARYRWIDRYLAGDEFARFVDSGGSARARRSCAKLGTGGADAAIAGVRRAVSAAGARRAGDHRRSPLRPPACAHRAAGHAKRAGHGWQADRADRRRRRARPAAAERAGFVIASAVLFWLDRARLRSRAIRCATRVFALGVSVGAYLLFARVLQLSLPAGRARRLAVATADVDGHAAARSRGGFANALTLRASRVGARRRRRSARRSACCPASARR